MSLSCITGWMTRLQHISADIKISHLDFIVDQCGIDFSVIPVLRDFSPSLQWQSLYLGLPENDLPEEAPLLIRIALNDPQQREWFTELAQKVKKTAPLLVVGSRWPFGVLAKWLTDCTDATLEGRAGLFRYFDARIFPFLFSDILTSEQQAQLQRPALFWSWLDRDDQSALLIGNGSPHEENEKCQKIAFSDDQFESLMCICDAEPLLHHLNIPDAGFTSRQEWFSACFRGMLSATEQEIMLDEDREEWVVNMLTKQHSEEI